MFVMSKRRCLLAMLLAHQTHTSGAFAPACPAEPTPSTRLRVSSSQGGTTQSSPASEDGGNGNNNNGFESQIRFTTRSFTSRTPIGRGTPSRMESTSSTSDFGQDAGFYTRNGHSLEEYDEEMPEPLPMESLFPALQIDDQIGAPASCGPQLRPKKNKQNQNQNQNQNKGGKNGRKYNKAMGDVAFLKKRTANLLAVTEAKLEEANQAEGDAEFVAPAPSEEAATGGMKVGKKSFHFLMDAWAFSGELDAPDQALSLLRRMEELWDATQQPNIQPDVRSYTKVMNAWSRSMREDAGYVTRQLLNHMSTARGVAPNAYTYTAVIEAFSNSGCEGAAEECEELCEYMMQTYLENKARREMGEKVTEEEDIRPTARCLNAAISAYGKVGHAARAEYLFDRMENLYWKNSQDLPDLKPTAFNYNSLITAWANCVEPQAAQRAEDVLQRLQQDPDIEPTTISYNAVIDAYAKAGDAPQAEAVLKQMTDHNRIQPNTRSFNTVINAWAKSGDVNAASRAEDLLDYMTELSKNGNTAVSPDAHSFCTVINAWARSQRPGKAERANNMYREMIELYEAGNKSVRPNVVAVNAVMNACAYTSDRYGVKDQDRAMEIAHKRLKDLETSPYAKPDQVTYGTFFKVCANQMPDCDTRHQLIRVLFKKCSQEGQVGNMVLNELKNMGPEDLYEQIIGRPVYEDVKMEDLPEEWWCNVVEGKWRRRRNN